MTTEQTAKNSPWKRVILGPGIRRCAGRQVSLAAVSKPGVFEQQFLGAAKRRSRDSVVLTAPDNGCRGPAAAFASAIIQKKSYAVLVAEKQIGQSVPQGSRRSGWEPSICRRISAKLQAAACSSSFFCTFAFPRTYNRLRQNRPSRIGEHNGRSSISPRFRSNAFPRSP